MKYKEICAILKIEKGVEEKLKNQKNNSGLIALVIVLFLLVLGLGGYLLYDKVLSSKTIAPINDDVTNNQSVVTNVTLQNKEEVTEGNVTAKVDNGSIKINYGNKERILPSVNAKYVYLAFYMDIESARLYYITNNNELYYRNLYPLSLFIDANNTNYGIKIADNVVGFIGTQSAKKYGAEDKVVESYPILNVLLSDGSVYSVSYAS